MVASATTFKRDTGPALFHKTKTAIVSDGRF